MIKLKLAVFALILLGPCASVYARRRIRPERTLPASLCAQSLVLMAVGSFLPFSAGVALLAAVSAAAWIDALLHVRSLRRAAGFFTLPCLIFLGSTLLLYEVCANRVYLSYDEYSHWGMLIKAIHLFDELPRAGRGAAYVQFTYPPGTAMLPAMACRLLGYRDGIAYFGYAMLVEGLLLGLASRTEKWVTACAAVLYLALMAIFPLGALRLFCEPVVALLMALLAADSLREEESRGGALLMAAMLAMTKNTGMVFLLMAVAARLAVRGRRELRTSVELLLCGAVPTVLYRFYCQAQGIEAVISPSHLRENLAALLSGTLGEPYISVLRRYVDFLFSHQLSQAGVYACYGFGTSAMVLGLVLLLCGAHVLTAADRRRALRLWAGVWLANLAYMAMIIVSYCFFFEAWEVERLSEADRYTMLIALWTALLACTLLLRELRALRPAWRAAGACALLAVLLPLSHPEMTVKTFVTREYNANTVWARDRTDRMTSFLKEKLAGMEDVRLLFIGDYEYVELHYTMAGMVDIGRFDTCWREAPWHGDAKQLRQALLDGGYDAVFVAGLMPDEGELAIDERYAALTGDGEALRAYSLYRVVAGEDGQTCLEYWATMPEEVY